MPDEANRDAPPTEPQPLLTNMLNRLWGQGGTPATPGVPDAGASERTSDDPPVPDLEDPPVPNLSSAIPDDYRERHRRREGNQHDQAEPEEQFQSYFS